jgi:hypothetical protein
MHFKFDQKKKRRARFVKGFMTKSIHLLSHKLSMAIYTGLNLIKLLGAYLGAYLHLLD